MYCSRNVLTAVVLLLALCGRYCSAQDGGCTPPAGSNLTSGHGKRSNNIPQHRRGDTGQLRGVIGGNGVDWWVMFSESQVRDHGLWCQVRAGDSSDMGSDIGDWYYPPGDTPDGFTLATNSSLPYQSLECTNTIGLLRIGSSLANNQGIVRCNTTITSGLDRYANYFAVYTDSVFSSYTGPTVEPNMKLSLLTPRDTDTDIMFTLSFTVSFGPPTEISCSRNGAQFFYRANSKSISPVVSREVIRSRYINSSYPDMTRVILTQTTPRESSPYSCTVNVISRTGVGTGSGFANMPLGSGTSTASITVASPPTAVIVNRTGFNSVLVSWSAPSLAPAGYEVFYQVAGGSALSEGDTSNTELTLTGLTLGNHSFFVVGYGAEGAPVLPSAHSNTASVIIDNPVPSNLVLTPDSTLTITVSWMEPPYPPNNYTVLYYCQPLCNSSLTIQESSFTVFSATHAIFSLAPGSSCTISVVAVYDGNGMSEMVSTNTNTTTQAPNGAPEGLTGTSVESRSLTVQWGTVPCPDQRGPITGYRLRYSNGTSIMNTTGEESRQHVLTGLTPFNSYSVQVAAVNAGGTGPYSTALTVKTLQDIPGPVSGLSATPGVTQLTISWTAPPEPNGVITMYQVTHNSTGVLNYTNTSATQLTLRDIPLNTAVSYSVRAYTIIGPGEAVSASTTTDIPQISIMAADAVNSTAVRVTWIRLNEPVVKHYTVHYSRVNGGSGRRRRQVDSERTVTFPASASSGVVSGLQEGQQYQFSVSVTLLIGGQIYTGTPGESKTAMTADSTTAPPTADNQEPALPIGPVAGALVVVLVLIIAAVVIVIVIVFALKRKKNAFAVHYVKEGPKVDSSVSSPNSMEPQYATCGAAVTVEYEYATVVTRKPCFESFPKDMTIIEGTSVEFPVKVAGTPRPQLIWYHESTLLDNDYAHEISTDGSLTIATTEMTHSGSYRLVAINSAGRAERKFTLKIISDTPDEEPIAEGSSAASHPVHLAELGRYVARNHADTNKGFTALYRSLDSCEGEHTVTVAVTATNKPLNRFNNITVYDDNHIVLQPITDRSDCQRNYINASYINGYDKERQFIACQGPLTKTVVDHWRLIWQEKANTIVMVTNLKENKKTKCQQYWPDSDSKEFGPFRITLADQQIFADYTIRLLQVELSGSSEYPRMITQYHFTSWPDHGVPEYGTPILAFHRRIRKEYKPSKGPIVVHCSAGVGRTGTFIAIDIILKQVEKEGIVDVSGVITNMRHQRMKMVQTPDQYTFIHDVILESVTCGDTQISSGELRPAIARMKDTDPASGKTLFQAQFEVLNQVTPNPHDEGTKCVSALQNKAKNRSMDYLPTDKYRVVLKQGNPDYINASFVNSYKHKRAFIVTQNPMENTSGDFWKMVVERDCRAIVMLNPLEENGQEVCYQYWLDSDSKKYGEYSVEVVKSTKNDGYVERIISVSSKTSVSHQVTQFQILNWNSQGKCSCPQTIITVVEEVNKVQRRTDNKPIVVHCSDTVSRSGMFCAIATTIDRCKTESVVDVFQVVKAQRIQKPGLVLTVEQYQFVFEAVLRFLESFETYSNFK